MAVMNTINPMIHEASAKVQELQAQLEAAKCELKNMIAKAKAEAQHALRGIEQIELEADYKSGDKSVVRDGSAGNGSGGYRRLTSNEMVKRAALEATTASTTAYRADENTAIKSEGFTATEFRVAENGTITQAW
jgi:hypothetical protein